MTSQPAHREELRYEGRVAVITGAGRGLGRAYSLLLAARGARVIVNDTGASLRGDPSGAAAADAVVAEIRAAGGQAVASTDSVATPEGGHAIVQTAIRSYGQIDILIHSAGIVRRASLKEIAPADFEAVLDVHLRGGFHVVREAFPLMCKARYGRIVLTSSVVGLYGNRHAVNYSVAKAGLLGLSNVVALEGAEEGVKCNAILPGAVTRMSEGLDTSAFPPMTPEMVAPVVAWLAHETCSITGEMLSSMAGRTSRAYLVESPGVYKSSWSPEDVAESMHQIRSTEQPVIIPFLPSGFASHLRYSFDMAARVGEQ